MATLVRRNTYVLRDVTLPSVDPETGDHCHIIMEPQTGIDRQNIMRLRVNRIALVQELQVEHISGKLLSAGVIDLDDLKRINKGTTSQDRTRNLLDLLPTRSKKTGWYRQFRESLLNPDADSDVRRRYKYLVSFLDNTVIHRPTSQTTQFRDTFGHGTQNLVSHQRDKEESILAKLPHYSVLPEIENKVSVEREEEKKKIQKNRIVTNDEDTYTKMQNSSQNSMTFVQGMFHQWLPTPENFSSLIDLAQDHCQRLLQSENPEDRVLLEKEETAVNNLRQVEVIAALARYKQLPSGFELCLCDAVQDILNQPELYHLYMKHFQTLKAAGVELVAEICSSFESVLKMLDSSKMSELFDQVIETGMKLADLLMAVNMFSYTDSVLTSTVQFLKQSLSMESWIPQYQACIKLMHARNLACQPDKAESAYFEAVQIQYQVVMMSFGQNILHDGALYAETSSMLLEHGSVGSAFGWAKKALKFIKTIPVLENYFFEEAHNRNLYQPPQKDVDPENPASIVRTLCVAINSYCAQLLASKAELLSIYVVQYARSKFGERHPMFLEALLQFCHFINEFRQDPIGLQASKKLLDAAEKTYGCESIQVALAHRAISKALMCLHVVDSDDYYVHAMEGTRIARAILGLNSPMLYIFLHTFASALQWKALYSPKEVQESTLRWAEAEAKQAHALATELYGEISLRSAQLLLLLGQIYSRMSKFDVAEKHLRQAVDYLKLCQVPSSIYLLQGMANLATFYKITHKPDLAIPRFQFVVDHIESTGCYLKWVHTCFQTLAELYASSGQNKNADAVQVKLSRWLKVNPMTSRLIDYSSLLEEPMPFKTFVTKTDLWATAVQKAMAVPVEAGLVALGEGEV